MPQRGHRLRLGAPSFQAAARVLRLFDFDFFFFGTATVGLQRSRSDDQMYVPVQMHERLRQAIGRITENERGGPGTNVATGNERGEPGTNVANRERT